MTQKNTQLSITQYI